MRLLLDTHILLWAAAGTLTEEAADYIEDESNALLFSPASLWEIVIKSGIGRDDFHVDATALYGGLLDAGYEELPVTSRHALLVGALPPLHKDPFDRIMLAQAAGENITLLTFDKTLAQYPCSVILVRRRPGVTADIVVFATPTRRLSTRTCGRSSARQPAGRAGRPCRCRPQPSRRPRARS